MKKFLVIGLVLAILFTTSTVGVFASEVNDTLDTTKIVENEVNENFLELSTITLQGKTLEMKGVLKTNDAGYQLDITVDGQLMEGVVYTDNPSTLESLPLQVEKDFNLIVDNVDFDAGSHTAKAVLYSKQGEILTECEKQFTKEVLVDNEVSQEVTEEVTQGNTEEVTKDDKQEESENVANFKLRSAPIAVVSYAGVKPDSRIFLDTFTNDNKTLSLSGWSMSNVPGSYVQVIVDGKIIVNEAERTSRDDVISAISGFGGKAENPNAGYSSTINVSGLSYGNHEIQIRTVNNNIVLSRIVRTIEKTPPKTMLNFESMANDDGILNISGWSMSEVEGTYLQVIVDGKIVVSGMERLERGDVLAAIKGYGNTSQNPKPGFKTSYDISALKNGSHEIQVRVVSGNTVVSTAYKTLNIVEAKNRILIENASVNNGVLSIAGWAMSGVNNTTIRITLDGGILSANFPRTERGDVLNAIKDCGTSKQNPKPGFVGNLNVTNFGVGAHELQVQLMQGNTVISTEKKTISIQPYSARVFVDNSSINNHIVTLNGWAMSTNPNMTLEMYVNGVKVASKLTRYKRDDVVAAIKGYGSAEQNPKPGYTLTADINGFPSGNNEIQVRAVYGTNSLSTQSVGIVNGAYNSNMNVDDVKITGNTVTARGWAMSDNRSTKVQFLVDGVLVADNVKRTNRSDVQNTVVGYGSASDNPYPGFEGSANVSSFMPGNHNFQVRVVSMYGELLSARTTVIRTRGTGNVGVDVSEHNGRIDWATTANHVDFAILRAGWGYFKEDSQFRNNIQGCEDNNVPYGIYLYSYALNLDEAKKEVDALLKAIEGLNPELPVYIDMEDADGYKRINGMPSDATLREICAYFCDRLGAAGYESGIYASLNWFNTKLSGPRLANYDKWVAQWNDTCDYQYAYQMWQYTSDGSVPGISTARVDMNYNYYK